MRQEFYKQPSVNAHGQSSKKRMHLRRGHIRRYKTGKTTWIDATTVKPQSDKKISKDYRIEILHIDLNFDPSKS